MLRQKNGSVTLQLRKIICYRVINMGSGSRRSTKQVIESANKYQNTRYGEHLNTSWENQHDVCQSNEWTDQNSRSLEIPEYSTLSNPNCKTNCIQIWAFYKSLPWRKVNWKWKQLSFTENMSKWWNRIWNKMPSLITQCQTFNQNKNTGLAFC